MYRKYKTEEEKKKKRKKILAILLPLLFVAIAAAITIPTVITLTKKQPETPDPGPTPQPEPQPYTGPTFKFSGTKLLGFREEVTSSLLLERFPNGSITIPECSEIASNAFNGKIPDKISEIVLPSNTTIINENAFANNNFNKLSFYKDKDISDWKLKTLGKRAFYNTKISQLTLPFDLESIGDECFASCNNLSNIDLLLKQNNTKVKFGNNCFSAIAQSGNVVVRLNTTDGWKDSLAKAGIVDDKESTFSKNWKISEYSCLDIEQNVCYGVKQDIPHYLQFLIEEETKDLIIPSNVEKISNVKGGFKNNQFMNKLTIPSSVVEIDKNCFVGCSNLNLIDVTEYSSVPLWSGIDIFEDCHDTGQVEVNNDLKVSWKQLFVDQSGLIIDENHWRVGHDVPCLENCMKVTASEESTLTLKIESSEETKSLDFQYKKDDGDWTVYTEPITIEQNHSIYLKGVNKSGWNDSNIGFYPRIKFTGKVKLSGSIMGLIGGDLDPPDEIPNEDCFSNLFSYCTAITSVDKNFLPAKKLKKNCYKCLFNGCTSLSDTPKLVATELAESCYESMFAGCTKLIVAPDLPDVKMEKNCCQSMFSECFGLTTMSHLPSTQLAQGCYKRMFYNCSKLTNVYDLPAETLPSYCYSNMFQMCYILEKTPNILATTLATNSCSNMFNNCRKLSKVSVNFDQWTDQSTTDWLESTSTTGTFICPFNLPIPSDRNGSNIPVNWEITNN